MRRTHTIGLALSVGCMLGVSQALAQTGPTLMITPWAEGTTAELNGGLFYTPTETSGANADLDLWIYEASGRFRLDPDSAYNPTIGFSYTYFKLDTADPALPGALVDMSVAFGGSFGGVDLGETFGGSWQMGYSVGLGYAGNAPFDDSAAFYAKADLFAIKPIDKDTRWLVGINYDGNRVFMPDVPLPVVTYFARLNDEITYGLGFPYSSITWTPTDRWTLSLESIVFFSFTGEVSYRLTDDLELFAAYVRRSDAFVLQGSADDRRVLFSQQRAEFGLNHDLGDNLFLVVAGGYAFGQEFEFGFDSRDPSSLRDLDDSGFVRAAIELRF